MLAMGLRGLRSGLGLAVRWRRQSICFLSVLLVACPLQAMPAAAKEDQLLHRFLEAALSPDGAIVASVEGDAPPSGFYPPKQDLVLRHADGSRQETIDLPCGHVEQCWPSSPAWSPDGRHLSFILHKPATIARSLYQVDADGGHLTKLLDFDGTLTNLRYAPDGRLAMLAVEDARKDVGAIAPGAPVTGDPAGPPREQRIAILDGTHLAWASPDNLYVYEYDWRPDGQELIGTAAPGDGDNNWWIAKLYAFSTRTGAGRVIYSPPHPRQQLGSPRVSRDGNRVAFVAGLMSDAVSPGGDILTVPLAGGPAVTITPEMHATAESVGWGCGGQLLAALVINGQMQIVDFGDGVAARKPRVLWSGSASIGSNQDGRLSDAGLSLACPSGESATMLESFAVAPEIRVGQVGKWHPLTAANTGMPVPDHARNVTWKSDGFDVQGWLLIPEVAGRKLPMIVIIHGGPAEVVTPFFIEPGGARTLLEKGFALFFPNPRGSFGQGERFVTANVRDFGYGDLRDVLRGIDAAERVAPIDNGRLGIMGASYGGFLTMWAVTQTHRFKAAVAVAGISDWQSYYGENGIGGWMLPYFGASVYDDPKIYNRSSPINFVRNVRTPTLAYVGADDIECPPPQTQEFWHALRELGVATSMVIYPSEGHGLRQPEHIADADRRVLEWFERYLK